MHLFAELFSRLDVQGIQLLTVRLLVRANSERYSQSADGRECSRNIDLFEIGNDLSIRFISFLQHEFEILFARHLGSLSLLGGSNDPSFRNYFPKPVNGNSGWKVCQIVAIWFGFHQLDHLFINLHPSFIRRNTKHSLCSSKIVEDPKALRIA